MAKIELNPLVQSIRGKLGGFLIRRVGKQSIISTAPDRQAEPSPAEALHHARFAQAMNYGRRVNADPASKAIYAKTAKRKGISVYARAIGDFMKSPIIERIHLVRYRGRVGDPIRILATDDFAVTAVEITITGADSRVLEQGPAHRKFKTDEWIYLAKKKIPSGEKVTIEATATDHPGNKTVRNATFPG